MNRAERRRRDKQARRREQRSELPADGVAKTLGQLLAEAINAHDSGDFPAATGLAEQVVRIQPGNAIAWHLLGRLAKHAERLDDAVTHLKRALEISPNHTPALLELGDVHLIRGEYDAALSAYSTVLGREPRRPEVHNGHGHALKGLGRWEAARDAFQRAVELAPNQPRFHRNLGIAHMELGDPVAAVEEADRAITGAPGDPNTLNLRGRALQALGRLDEAARSFRDSIAADPLYAPAHRNLAELKTHTSEDAEVLAMRSLYARDDIPKPRRIHLAFGLGKAYDDLNLPDQAFNCFQEGNALRRAAISFSIDEMCGELARMAEIVDQSFLERHAGKGVDDETPVFIVGMPRCGSTLAERILARQPDVHGAGEIEDMLPIMRDDLLLDEDRTLDNLQDCGLRYRDGLRARAPEARRIVDKNLANFAHVGLIAAMFPRASILHCTRHPLDTCLSIYTHSFRGRHDYAYDLRELGLYYRAYQDLMAHWHALLGDRMHTVRYEAMVADEATETRALLAYCGLEVGAVTDAYDGSDDIVLTSSNAQVRRPIYTSAVARWKGYAEHLGPLIEAIGLDPKEL